MPDADLTPDQLKALEHLGQSSKPVVSRSISEEIGDALEDLGLMEAWGQRMASGRRHLVQITAAGRRRLAQIDRERSDLVFRLGACRNQLLIFADRDPSPSPWPWLHNFIEDADTGLHGTRFDQQEAHRAALHLDGERLLDYCPTSGGDGTFKITHQGSKCVANFDGDVSAWERHQMMSAGHRTTITQGAGSSANVVAGNGNVVSQTATADAIVEEAAKWIEDLRHILPLLAVPADKTAQVDDAVAELETEIEARAPEPSRIRERGRAIRNSLIQALSSAAIAQAPMLAEGLLNKGQDLFG